MSALISTEFPLLTSGNFESSLASDDVLALFFNDFLSLPSFSEDVMYNQESGLFELVNGAADCVSRRIRAVLKHIKSQLLAGDTTVLTRNPPVGNHYTVFFLDGEKGIQWIKREKLPFFLKSDCYYEYRLSKLLLQQGRQLSNPRNKSSSGLSASQLNQCSQFTKQNNDAVKVLSSHCEESKSANQGFSPCHLKYEQSQELHSSQTDWRLSFAGSLAVIQEEPCCQMSDPPEQKFQDAVSMVGGLHLLNTEESVKTSARQKTCTSTENEKEVQTEWDEKNKGSGVRNQENSPDTCWDDPFCCGTRPVFHQFSEVLQGRQGAKLLRLWMDIERLKAAKNTERKNRHLVPMRNRYLLSQGCSSSLNVGLLSRLGLTTSPCWTEDKLLSVQPYITESLLGYWGNQFWFSHRVQEFTNDSTASRCPDTCSTRPPHITQTELLFSRTRSLCSGRMEKLLKALCVESRSGLYFTHFCEQSGNQLWVNAVYFWTDLQYYHELFHQEELDPYRVQREAQILHFTYICRSAERDIGIDEVLRKEVYDRLMPASEEMFDRVEQHVLNVLLEPWTLLVSRDRESFHQVCVQEEVRCINSPEYRELLGLYEESHQKPKEVEESKSSPTLDSCSGATSDDLLRSILGQHHQIENFKYFLQKPDARIHLSCWLDLEEYRRTLHKDRAIRQDRSLHIATKYLNERYFFGPRSPATAEQQDDMLRSAGGHERLKSECLSDSAVVGIQHIIKNHIEETWLPAFLSTTKPTERQEHKAELHAADTLSLYVNHRQRWRREASKAQKVHPEGLWMSSSEEILLFRRVLLNPVTSQQFQYFVSLKGGFLENDVRFWVEVQRYKDLCHSHSDEATIQQKISIIITCFINSPMQPTLQIDIPPDQAQRILKKRHELGPYIFREAQISVFGELLKFWPEFQKFTSSVQEEQLLPLLHEKRVQYRARQRRWRRKEEEEEEKMRRAQEELVRRESCFTEVDDEGEEMERKERGVKKQSTWSRTPTPTQPLLQSCSKYMVGLKREDVLLRKQSQPAASSSTASESSSDCGQ